MQQGASSRAIEGFLPLKYGGEDTAACIMARMRGWKTWSFADVKVIHHRATGLGSANSILKARFVQGKNEYGLGSDPLFVLLKSVRRCVRERPLIISGIARVAGYIYGYVRRIPRQMPEDAIRFYRKEQRVRILRCNKIPRQWEPRRTWEKVLGDAPDSGDITKSCVWTDYESGVSLIV